MKHFRFLFVVVPLLVTLGINNQQVKAYGNSTITANCPTITFSAISDHPKTYRGIGTNYVVVVFTNLTTGRITGGVSEPTRSERIVTASGSMYTRYYYDDSTTNFLGYVMPGERYDFKLLDSTGLVGELSGICTSSSIVNNSYPPSSYRLMTIMCPAYILTTPGGAVLPPYNPSEDTIPQVGKQRYVMLVGAIGPDGQRYDKIQAYAFTFGYFPERCLGQ